MTLYSRDDDKHEALTENKALVYLPYNFIKGKKAIRGPLNSEHSHCPLKRSQTFDFPFSNSHTSGRLDAIIRSLNHS